MFQVLLTCPRDLLCLIGLSVHEPPQRRDAITAVGEALHALGGQVSQRRERFIVELADPVDAVLAYHALHRALPDYDLSLASVVLSAVAVEMLADVAEPTRTAWFQLTSLFYDLDPLDFRRGCCAVRHFDQIQRRPVPDAIATQALPETTGIVLWSVTDGDPIVVVDRDPFIIGRMPDCDLQIDSAFISRAHHRFERRDDGWVIRDTGSTSGFYINDHRVGDIAYLQPGMVIQFARPHAFVVLSVR